MCGITRSYVCQEKSVLKMYVRMPMVRIYVYIRTRTLHMQCAYLYVYMYSVYLHACTLLESVLMCARTYGVYALCLDGVYVGVCVTSHIHVWDYTFVYLSRVECFDDVCVCAYGAYIRIYTCTHAAYAVCMFLYIHIYHV